MRLDQARVLVRSLCAAAAAALDTLFLCQVCEAEGGNSARDTRRYLQAVRVRWSRPQPTDHSGRVGHREVADAATRGERAAAWGAEAVKASRLRRAQRVACVKASRPRSVQRVECGEGLKASKCATRCVREGLEASRGATR